ncbi:MurR/RpiR family transcriptional regulator [Clostridium paraputrificum]|uniref:MurR/RpiR family transcriptional regulator n=1 Tax=Clostridium TaxID=1485 RepID=UPI003D3261E4
MNIENLIHKHNLDSLERKIIQYLYNNIERIKTIGIRKVASDNFTSTSMIYKLAKKLGFEGYADMIHYIAYSYSQSENLERLSNYSELYKSVQPYKEDFNRLINSYKNKQIVITGMGFCDIISNFISEALFIKGFKCASTLHMELLSENYKDDLLIIAISQSGETSRLVEVIKEARGSGFKVITITANKNSHLANMANLIIPIGEYDSFKTVSKSFNTFFGELLIAFEYLIN